MLKEIKKLCTPAFLYFSLSVFSLIMMVIQNMFNKNNNMFCLGNYSCNMENSFLVYVTNIFYILFFTWLLNSLCKMGYEKLSWFILFLPFIFYFVVLGLFMIFQNNSVSAMMA